LGDLCLSGDIRRNDYRRQPTRLHDDRAKLPALTTTTEQTARDEWRVLREAGARFLQAGTAEQNVICRALFERVTLNADRTVEVFPRPELAPFFRGIVEPKFNYCGSDGDWLRVGVTETGTS